MDVEIAKKVRRYTALGRANKRKYDSIVSGLLSKVDSRCIRSTKHARIDSTMRALKRDFDINNNFVAYESEEQAHVAWVIHAVKCIHSDVVFLFEEKGRRFEHAQLEVLYSSIVSIAHLTSSTAVKHENAVHVCKGLGIEHFKLQSANSLSDLLDVCNTITEAYSATFGKLSMPRRFGKTEILGCLLAAVQYRMSPKDLAMIAQVKAVVESGIKNGYEQALRRLVELYAETEPVYFVYRGGYFASHSKGFSFKWQDAWSGYTVAAPDMTSKNKAGNCLCVATSGKSIRGQDSSFVVLDEAAASSVQTLCATIPLANSTKCHMLFASTKSLKKASKFWDAWTHLRQDDNQKKIFNTVETFLACPYCIHLERQFDVKFSHTMACAHYSHFLPPHTLAGSDTIKVMDAVKQGLGRKELQGVGDMDMDMAKSAGKNKMTTLTPLTPPVLVKLMRDKRLEFDTQAHTPSRLYTYMDPSLSIHHCMAIATVAVLPEEVEDMAPSTSYLNRLCDHTFVVLGMSQIPLPMHDPDINPKCLVDHVAGVYKIYADLVETEHVIVVEGNAASVLPLKSYQIAHARLSAMYPGVPLLYYTKVKPAAYAQLMKKRTAGTNDGRRPTNRRHVFGNTYTYHHRTSSASNLPVFDMDEMADHQASITGFIMDEHNKVGAYNTLVSAMCTGTLAFASQMAIQHEYDTSDLVSLDAGSQGILEMEALNRATLQQITREVQCRQQDTRLGSVADSLPRHHASRPGESGAGSSDDEDGDDDDDGPVVRPHSARHGNTSLMTDEEIHLGWFAALLESDQYSSFLQIHTLKNTNRMLVSLYRQLMKTTVAHKTSANGKKKRRLLQTPRPDDLMVSLMCSIYVAYTSIYNSASLRSILLRMDS